MSSRVTRKLDSLWKDSASRARAREILDRYEGDGTAVGRERIQLAMLKLAGGSLEELEECLEAAQRDFRDVVAAAEYPEALRSELGRNPALSPEEQSELEAMRRRDRLQYERWLNE